MHGSHGVVQSLTRHPADSKCRSMSVWRRGSQSELYTYHHHVDISISKRLLIFKIHICTCRDCSNNENDINGTLYLYVHCLFAMYWLVHDTYFILYIYILQMMSTRYIILLFVEPFYSMQQSIYHSIFTGKVSSLKDETLPVIMEWEATSNIS